MIVRKNDNTRPCRTCARNHMGSCSAYRSAVTGTDAPISDARALCGGTDWEQRQNGSAIANAAPVTFTTTPYVEDAFAIDQNGNKYFSDRIVKPDGTIVHTDTPNKLYE